MVKHDFYTSLNPTETAMRINTGREQLLRKLVIPSTAHDAVDNHVDFSGAFTSAAGDFDQFSVTTHGAGQVTEADKAHFISLGCTIYSCTGRTAIVRKLHSLYDQRLFKIDMTTPQCCMAFFILALACALASGALLA